MPAEKPTPEERLAAGEGLRIGEVAALSGNTRGTIHLWIKEGKWKPVYTRTLGGQRRFKAESVRALLAQLREEQGGEEAAEPTGSESTAE